ncbi:MAG: glycosyltransferase, partial [Candidatus Pacebacteria bacterium]|nr:glycosyltransferase [Candidatus Paceibacterota bacterium]
MADAGYDVLAGGLWFDQELARRDILLSEGKKWRFQPIVDFRPEKTFKNIFYRLKRRLAKELFRRAKIFTPELLGYGIREISSFARKYKADLTIVHSEEGLWVGDRLLREGFNTGVDFEDWFSESFVQDESYTPFNKLKELERRLAVNCKYCLTMSRAMAKAIAGAYQAKPPEVVYNVFPWAERDSIDQKIKDRKDLGVVSLNWFSQNIGKGRGLDVLMLALRHIKVPLEIHLRGNYPEPTRRWFEPLIPADWRGRVFIHSTVPNTELLSRIAEHDIGLALESDNCLNRTFSVSNKLMQYLLAGLGVIAFDIPGQREILSDYPDVGIMVPVNDPLALARA